MNLFYHIMLLASFISYGFGNQMTICKQFKSPLNNKPVKEHYTGQTIFLERNGLKGEKGEKGNSDENEIELLKKKVTELCYAGIKNGRVPDSAMTASSAWSDEYRAFYGRLDRTGDERGFWHAGRNQDRDSWLQVDFGREIRLVGVVTQGRPLPKHSRQWVSSYKILYGNSPLGLKSIRRNGQDVVFQGNRDETSKVINEFPQPITARYFRLLVVSWQHNAVLRIEYLTC